MPTNSPEILITHDPAFVGRKAAEEFARTAQRAVEARGRALIALSGGTTARHLLEVLTSEPFVGMVPWERTEIFWGDERFVPASSDTSNHGAALRQCLHLVEDEAHLHLPPVDLPSTKAAAARYEETVRRVSEVAAPGVPSFDLIFLGMGEDGHVASLFPGQPTLGERSRLVIEATGPAPARDRISFTPPLLLAARRIAVLVCGAGKAPVVRDVLGSSPDPSRLPAQILDGASGHVVWILDRLAAQEILPSRDSGDSAPAW